MLGELGYEDTAHKFTAHQSEGEIEVDRMKCAAGITVHICYPGIRVTIICVDRLRLPIFVE